MSINFGAKNRKRHENILMAFLSFMSFMKGVRMNTEKSGKLGEELLSITIEGLPPTVNHMHINARGRRFRSQECVAYQDYVIDKIIQTRGRECPFSGRVALTLIFTAPNKRRWDIDNRVKSIQDCLARAGVIKDDTQIDVLTVLRFYGEKAKTRLILYSLPIDFAKKTKRGANTWDTITFLSALKDFFFLILKKLNG